MTWTRPTFDIIKMDAEIGSYQEENDRDDDSLARTAVVGASQRPRLLAPHSPIPPIEDGAGSSGG